MKKDEFPYINCGPKELSFMETHYFLVMGGDFVFHKEVCMFSKKELAIVYNKTLDNILDMVEGGDPKEKQFGISLIGSLRIMPVRIH